MSAYKGNMTNANRPALVLSTDLPHARASSRASCACGMGLHSTERAVANWARVHKIMYPTCSPTMTRQTWQGGTLVPTTVSV